MFTQAQVNAMLGELSRNHAYLLERNANLILEVARLNDSLATMQANFERVSADLSRRPPEVPEAPEVR